MSDKKGILGFLKGLNPLVEENELLDKESPSQEENKQVSVEKSLHSCKITEEIETFCVEALKEILEKAGLLGTVSLKESQESRLYIDISDSGEDISRVIGKLGANLESLQIILRHFVIRKFNVYIKVIIDADHYRQRRYGAIKAMAIDAAGSLEKSGDNVKLESMSPYERSVIHGLFEDDDTISTESEGEGSNRCVVLSKK